MFRLSPSRLPARCRRLGPWALGMAVALWAVIQAHTLFIIGGAVATSPDEGSIGAFAMRLLDGHMLPYVDAVSQRGPLTYWLDALAQGMSGAASGFLSMRLLALVLALATTLLAGLIPLCFGRRLAGSVAALTTAYCMTVAMSPHAGVGYNAELASLPFTVGGTLLLVRATTRVRRSPRLWPFVVAGVLIALGGLCKQLALVFALPPLLALGLIYRDRQRWRSMLGFAAGVAVPPVLVVLLYAISGHFHELWYWTVEYNSAVYMAPVTGAFRRHFTEKFLLDHAMLVWLSVLLLACGLWWSATRPFARTRRGPRPVLMLLLALDGALSVLVALAPARPWENYFLYCVPWFAIVLGLAMDRAVRTRSRARWTPWLATGFVSAVLVVGVWAMVSTQKGKDGEHYWESLDEARSCRFVDAHSKPDQSLFVWGFRGDLYLVCQRKPASRYVVTPPVAGWIPWFPSMSLADENKYAAPGTREKLIAELEKNQPAVLVDAPYDSMAGRSIFRYAKLARYVRANYCVGARIGHSTFLYRRTGPTCR